MKKILLITAVLLAGYAAYHYTTLGTKNSANKKITAPNKQSDAIGSAANGVNSITNNSGTNQVVESVKNPYEEVKPATQLYTSAGEAFNAVLEGAKDYDDLILEQFVDIGNNCAWCPEFFADITEKMLSADSSEDEKSYFAEILAISGSVDNISVLVDAIKNAASSDEADLFAEALELSMGDDAVVDFLAPNLKSDNELLKESSIAAITNHGSRKAVDLLYQQTIENADPDGYYSLGIGLGELIPDEESLPTLIELANKKDDYSHLPIKALLNYGESGLRTVLDLLANFNDDLDFNKLLDNAVDHVAFENTTEQMLKEKLKNPANKLQERFIKEILDEMAIEDQEDAELEEE